MEIEGSCPKCGGADREYICTEYDDNYEGFIYKCAECGCEYIEWYGMKYDSTEVLRNGEAVKDKENK